MQEIELNLTFSNDQLSDSENDENVLTFLQKKTKVEKYGDLAEKMEQEHKLEKIAGRYFEDEKKTESKDLPKSCQICFEDFMSNEMVNILKKCNDVFHYDCLK